MISLILSSAFANSDLSFQYRILPNEKERIELTKEYLEIHRTTPLTTGEEQGLMIPRVIVVHWTANYSVKGTYNLFSNAYLRGRTNLQPHGRVNVSAHYIVDRDGSIVQILPENRVARHCIGLNHLSIGIENIGGLKGEDLTEEQLQANIFLIEKLSTKYPITHLIGHFEYQQMESHPYFDEKFSDYRTVKIDPGRRFMEQLRVSEEIQKIPVNQPPLKKK
jgi:N-acetyl-anhydromuramyl-L-alanine amidase AmpD